VVLVLSGRAYGGNAAVGPAVRGALGAYGADTTAHGVEGGFPRAWGRAHMGKERLGRRDLGRRAGHGR
jgi:hypothetical protein